MCEYAVSMQGINKSFGGVSVLRNVGLKVKKGTIHALIGGNGAGKSTLMKILTGVLSSDGGSIVIDGKPVKINNPNDANEHGIRMIFQELSLIPTLTVVENIFLNHEEKSGIVLNKKKMAKQAGEIIREIGFEVDLNKRISDIDVGICQLIEIAKALSGNSKILVMDEPTTALTKEETEILFGIMRKLKERGISIIYISHRLQEVLDICDEISVLRDGENVITQPRSEFTMNSLIESIIGKTNEGKFEYKPRTAPISDEIMLDVKDLTWKGNPHKVSFAVRKGEVLGLAGLLGSGRTEIVDVLFGIRKQGDAKITLDGEELQIKSINNAIRKGIVLVPEDRRRQGLILIHTLLDNICLPNLKRLVKGIKLNIKKTKSLSSECVEEFNIKTDTINSKILSLSGGNQQKVVIAKWFKTNPKVILMDEPTAGVDIGSKGEIIELIRRFSEEGKSVILISSELSEMLAICDRLLIVKKGEIKGEIQREEILNEEELHYAVQHE